MTGTVYLVGAGCGGASLITVRGMELLRGCDAVVYDDLVAPTLLSAVPEGAERIPVGKRAGRRSPKQETINRILIEKASEGKTVVRLKGGDPFLFGRGGEEAIALSEAGIPYEVVPGISSALAIPLEAGIPVTHRALSRSVHIVTAHTAEQQALPDNLPRLAALDGTLVFLMGLHALERLAQALIEAGKPSDTPAAVLSGGNSPHPAEIRGTLSDIAERTRAAGVQTPAVIVVGQVAQMDLRSPQTSVTVGLTGTEAFRQKLARLFVTHGVQTVPVQRGRCVPLDTPVPWEALARQEGNWLVFTSGRGVDFFFRRLRAEQTDLRALSRCRFAVIGEATAAALAEHGIRADLCPESFTGEALAETLKQQLSTAETAWLFASAKSTGVIPEMLGKSGIACRRISLYDTVYETLPQTDPPRYLVFGSAGAVKALAEDGYAVAPETVPVCIGPVCAGAFERLFHRTPLVPEQITAEAMAQTVLAHIEQKKSNGIG